MASEAKACSWPFIWHQKWSEMDRYGRVQFLANSDKSSVDRGSMIAVAFLLCVGLKLLLLHLAGKYSTRRKYYEPLALEVKAYSADIGSTIRKTALDESALAGQEVPDYAASIVLALLDPFSSSYSFDLALHDYSRTMMSSIVIITLTRGLYYIVAYHVFTYCARENFSCVSDFLHRRYNSMGLANLSTILILAMEACQLILLYNRVAREMLEVVGGSFQFWLFCLSVVTFCLALSGTASLIRIAMLIYGVSILAYFWISLQLRFTFSSQDQQKVFSAWKLKSYETQKEQSYDTADALLYDSNLVCIVLAAPLLHTTLRLNQTEYVIYQSLARRFKRKRVFVRAFLLTLIYQLCHSVVLRSLFALRVKEGCDEIFTGLHCHYGLISNALKSNTALRAFYVTMIFYHSCWLGGLKVISMAYTATRSRMMRSFVEVCLIGQRWSAMNRWRRQNGLIMFRDCDMIDLRCFIYQVFTVAITGCVFLFCLDYIATDPTALGVQFANYLLLDLRFIVCFNATAIGLTFRRLSKSGVAVILIISGLIYTYQVLWADRLTVEIFSYKTMTPLSKSHTAWLRRKCPRVIRLRPVINVGKRTIDHEVVHLVDSDAFYPALLGLTWAFAAVTNCVSSGQLAVLKTPYYVAGDALSLAVAQSLRSQLFNQIRHMINSARSSLRSVQWRLKRNRDRDLRSGAPEADSDAELPGPMSAKRKPRQKSSGAAQQEAADLLTLTSHLARSRYAAEETALVLNCLSEAGTKQRAADITRRRPKVTRTGD